MRLSRRFHRSSGSLLALCLLAGCSSAHAIQIRPYRSHADRAVGTGYAANTLIAEPEQGVRPLVREIDRAQRTVFVESYILTEKHILRSLQRAAAQGVDVRVLVERHPFGLSINPERQVEMLRAAGVQVKWGRSLFTYTHAKYIVLDDRTVIVGTGNLSRSAFAANRDFFVYDNKPLDVKEISNVFRADWDRISPVLTDADVAVSPDNSRIKLQRLISMAKQSIRMYGEEIADSRVEGALAAMHARGVDVRLLLPWHASSADVARLVRRHVQVRELRKPYIHAKYVGIDGRVAWIGSVNFSSNSLDHNREVALILKGKVTAEIGRLFDRDWHAALAAHGSDGLP